MLEERLVAGLRCGEVLAQLSAYMDGELSSADCARIDGHVSACDLCERFGGEFASAVRALREHLAEGPLQDDVRRRLRRRLAQD
jgi:anti-sigma factor RsiW